MSDCLETIEVEGSADGIEFVCHLPLGHGGLHMETWTTGSKRVLVVWE